MLGALVQTVETDIQTQRELRVLRAVSDLPEVLHMLVELWDT